MIEDHAGLPAANTDASGSGVEIEELDVEGYRRAIPDLVELTLDAVASGASINFLADTSADQIEAWWSARGGSVAGGLTSPFVARLDGRLVGSTLLVRSGNRIHRIERRSPR